MLDSRRQGLSADHRSAHGFTLLELMVTVAIVAILAAMAFPSYREFTTRMTTSNNTNELIGALNLARSEAVKRGRQVAVIAINGNWANGWQVVAGKADATGAIAAPAAPGTTEATCRGYLDFDGATPLCPRFNGALPNTYYILGKATGAGALDDRVVFGSSGALVGSASNFDFSVCRPSAHADSNQSRHINVRASGIVTTNRGTSGSPAGPCS
ncbi:GspH/FimT family pseudopilin [Dokdonella fugitiva]|uniref:GspH/FimT family pseudopilin n=1 Tax=Dokdonella fugitiva TaxID=328517 RepID=UPI0028735998|nr:GspH/FimT family pseudopilin [Dokdonella fugitiva]